MRWFTRNGFARSLKQVLAVLGVVTATLSSAAAAQSWPNGPVTLVVGVPAGSAPDVYARVLAEQLSRQTGATFVVENRPGANGNLSADAVLRAKPDGQTLWIGSQAMVVINPFAFDNMRWKPSDFKAVIKGVEAPMVLVTHPSTNVKTFAEFTKWAKNPANKVAYASFSPGTPSHFLGYQLNELLNAEMVHIPYKGSSQQVTDILGGQVKTGFTQLAVSVPHIKEGRLNAIAVTSAERSRYLPDVPTLAELGHKDLGTTVWFGLFAPSRTPAAALEAMRKAAKQAQSDPAFRSKLEAQTFDVPNDTVAQFEKTIEAESARWSALVKATGFKATE